MTIFEEEKGIFSIRRVGAFILILSVVVSGIISIFNKVDKGLAGVVVGIETIGFVLLLFFTTWQDISLIVNGVKNIKNGISENTSKDKGDI